MKYTKQILSALAYLHANWVVHRSLAPHNIRIDLDGTIKLSGYGLYHMTSQSKDVDFPIAYAEYLPPETVATWDRAVRILKADVWSIGIILCELYTGGPFWTD